ncbi:MAG: bacteriophage holin [Candidatus Omnitrophica bacterium]|nr:bacteriophage holin [Candidatus Omnitrophota bacterium]
MKLSVKGLGLACGILWAVAVFLVGICNQFVPAYGGLFLQLVDSIYPGYHAGGGYSSVVIGSLYAFLDALIGGALFAWLYNKLAK